MTRSRNESGDSASGTENSDSATGNSQPRNTQGESRRPSRRSEVVNALWSLIQVPFVSHSRSRSRSPHRHRHHHGRRRRFRFKHRERNFLAAVCSMVVIVTLSTAMAAPNWFYLRGGGCRDKMDNPIHTLSVYQFFYMGHFTERVADHGHGKVTETEYRYSPNPADGMINKFLFKFRAFNLLLGWGAGDQL